MKSGLEVLLRGSVQKKILLLVLLSFLAPFGIIINNGIERQRNALNTAKAEALYLVEQEADVQRAVADLTRQMLVSLSVMRRFVKERTAASNELLSQLSRLNPAYSNILLLNDKGAVDASGLPTDGQINSAMTSVFQSLSQSRDFAVLGVAAGENAGSLVFSYPLVTEGNFQGMDAAVVRLDQLERDFFKDILPVVATLEVADRSGEVLYSTYANGADKPHTSRLDEQTMAMLSGEDERGVELFLHGDGTGSITAFHKLALNPGAPPYLFIIARLPAAEVLRRANAVLLRDVTLAIIAAGIALLTALVAGRIVIAGKLKRIIDVATQMGRGQLNARTGIDYGEGELGCLAHAFDAMADDLAKDIARRELAEKNLDASRDFLDKIINSIGDPILVKDSRHRFILVSDAMCALTGVVREDLLGKTDYDFFPTEQVDFFWSRDDAVLNTGEEDVSEEVISDAQGDTRIIVTKKTRYIDSAGNRFVVAVIRDVTDNKKAGNELLKRTEELDLRVKMLDCLYGISHLGQMRFTTLEQLLPTAAGLTASVLTYMGACARIVCDSREYLSDGFAPFGASIAADILVRGKVRGRIEAGYPLARTISGHDPFSPDERKILEVVAEHLGSIAERIESRMELQEMNLRLEQLVKDRTADLFHKSVDLHSKAEQLQAANKELELTARKLDISRKKAVDATKAKSAFLANMSHEVRTPINAVLGLADLALRSGATGEAKRFLEMILTSSRGLLGLVNDILDFSKLEAGRATVESIDFNLPLLVRDIVAAFAVQAEAKKLRLDVVIDDDVPRAVTSDPTKLRSILVNLFSNAIKFTENGHVAITVRYYKHVTTFEVADTGIGIPEDMRVAIFESFRQADETVGRKFGGTGLGLSICRKLAELLGGTIAVTSRPEGGSLFTLKLPLIPGKDRVDEEKQHVADLESAARLVPMRVLLAEDQEIGRKLLTTFLARYGHTVVCAVNGALALDALRQGTFDLVLMDGRMPVMDGMQAARAIRAGECGMDKAAIPIVAITAQAMEGDRRKFLAAGMNDYVTKPVDLDEILRILIKYSPHAAGRKDLEAPGRQPGGAGLEYEELPLLDREEALARLKNMETLLAAMERTFVKATPEDLAELHKAAEADDFANMKLFAHRVKGNASGIGAKLLSEAAREAEASAERGEGLSEAVLDRLEELFRRTCEVIPRGMDAQ